MARIYRRAYLKGHVLCEKRPYEGGVHYGKLVFADGQEAIGDLVEIYGQLRLISGFGPNFVLESIFTNQPHMQNCIGKNVRWAHTVKFESAHQRLRIITASVSKKAIS